MRRSSVRWPTTTQLFYVSGYAVHNFAWQLGRAVMTSAQPTEAGGPDRVNAQVTVDKKVYVDTTFNGKHAPASGEFDFEGWDAY